MYEFISNDEEARSVRHGINSNKTWEFILNNSQILYDKSDDLSSSSISVNMEEKLFEGSEFTLSHYMGHLAEIRLKFKSPAGESVAYHMVSCHICQHTA